MRDLWRPAAIAAVLLTPFLILGACKAGSAPEVVKEPAEKPPVAGFTHDGAVPIAVISSFEDARRAIEGAGVGASGSPAQSAAVACSFLTETAQERLVEQAGGQNKERGKERADGQAAAQEAPQAPCAAALQALVTDQGVPAKVESFQVADAQDEVTEVVVVRLDGTAEAYTLTGSFDDGAWLIDTIATTEAPEPETPETETEGEPTPTTSQP